MAYSAHLTGAAKKALWTLGAPFVLFFLLAATVKAEVQQQEKVPPEPPQWAALRSPEEVPDYLAWRYFFWSVDRNYRLGKGFYYGFINLNLKLGPLFQGDRTAGERVIQALADRAALANRDEERFRSEGQYRRRFMQMGAITEAELQRQDRHAFREQVAALQRACHDLRNAILAIAPNTGEAIWERIDEYVQTSVKSGTSVMIGPGRDGGYETMLEFQTPRPEKPRKK